MGGKKPRRNNGETSRGRRTQTDNNVGGNAPCQRKTASGHPVGHVLRWKGYVKTTTVTTHPTRGNGQGEAPLKDVKQLVRQNVYYKTTTILVLSTSQEPRRCTIHRRTEGWVVAQQRGSAHCLSGRPYYATVVAAFVVAASVVAAVAVVVAAAAVVVAAAAVVVA